MQRDCGRAAVPAYFLLPPPNGTHELPPGASMIEICCQDLAPLPGQHAALANWGDLKEQDMEEPKKRKGGWPKGKKRKPPRDLPIPRAPTTGYLIFLNEQRSQLRAGHPNLPFTEITKMLAAQWAQLPHEKKQRYVYQADEDKQRYIRELQAYQSSEAYRAFLQRRAAHRAQALWGAGAPGSGCESEGLDFSAVDAWMDWHPSPIQSHPHAMARMEDTGHEDAGTGTPPAPTTNTVTPTASGRCYQSANPTVPGPDSSLGATPHVVRETFTPNGLYHVMGDENRDLYCRTCRQFFSSLHNKKEHLLGKQHLQNLTGEFEKDSAEYSRRLESLEEEEGRNLNKGASDEEAKYPHSPLLGGLIPEKSFASLNLCFLQEFIFKLLKIKEFELRELKRTLERAQAEQEALQRQLAELQTQQQRLEVELAGLRAYGAILEKEFENLGMVPMPSHFGLQLVDTA